MNILNNPSKFQDFHAIEVVLEPSTWIIALNFEVQITTRTSWKWLGPLFYHVFFCLLTLFFPKKTPTLGLTLPPLTPRRPHLEALWVPRSSWVPFPLRTPGIFVPPWPWDDPWKILLGKKQLRKWDAQKTFQLCTIYIYLCMYTIYQYVYINIFLCV